MKEIAMGVYDVTGSGVYEVSEDGKVVIVKAGVFVLEDPHARVKKHIDADPKLLAVATLPFSPIRITGILNPNH